MAAAATNNAASSCANNNLRVSRATIATGRQADAFRFGAGLPVNFSARPLASRAVMP